jgi:hypothetical protein
MIVILVSVVAIVISVRFAVWQDTPRAAYTATCPRCGELRRLEYNLSRPHCRRCYDAITAVMM